MDLADPVVRAGVTARLGALYDGRPVLLGPGRPAGWRPWVTRLRALGSAALVVEVTAPPTVRVSDALRHHDRLLRTLPDATRATIDAFDPEHRGRWQVGPFVTSDEPIDGRPVLGGRPASYLRLEDKTRADAVWAAAGVPHAAYRIVAVGDPRALDEASAELAGPGGAVWSGDGLAGAGDRVRWVRDRADRVAARADLVQHCRRVRVQPYLDGVPCSVHGLVLPTGTAALRPVRIGVRRDPATRRFVPTGLDTGWEPPPAEREEMRGVARRVGAHLAAEHGYRGAFGIDGVLTADGFRPTELNPRMSGGLHLLAAVDPDLLELLQTHLLAGLDPGLDVADVESLVPLMDARPGRAP